MGLDLFINKVKSDNIAYFRKVNFLIPYFKDYYHLEEICNLENITIDEEAVEELIDRCKSVLNDHSLAEDLLPTTSGFFFGSTDYDEDYFKSVEDVLETMISIVLPKFSTLQDDESLTFQIWF